MSDLIEFLQARLAEQSKTVALLRTLAAVLHENARPVLADVASQLQRDADAKRRILDEYRRMVEDFEHATETVSEHARRAALEDVVQLLAAPHADHADFKEGWKL